LDFLTSEKNDKMSRESQSKSKGKIYNIAITGLMATCLCIVAPLSIPVGIVPLSFTTFAAFLSLYLIGWKKGVVSYVVYVLIGLAGLPVFSGFSGGPGRLLGPTGGFIVGIIPAMIIVGAAIEKSKRILIHFASFAAGTVLIYVSGAAWFCLVTDSDFNAAIAVCVAPFVIADVVKIIVVMIAGPLIAKRVRMHRA
jgi:biotin transport system substrate-specific component